MRPERPTVYLAGPMVFDPAPERVFDTMRAVCARHGLLGVSPLDNQVGLAGVPPGRGLARAIVEADIALMRRVDAGVFCLDGFRRGPEMDPGTAFEIGYMHALGKPLAGWTRDVRLYPERVADYFADRFGLALQPAGTSGAGAASGATSGGLRDPDGVLVHSEGCWQNAMTQMGIELSGGSVHAHPDWRAAFEAAIGTLARVLAEACGAKDTDASAGSG